MPELSVIMHENVQVNKLYVLRLTKENLLEYLKIKGIDFGEQDIKVYLRTTDNAEVYLENDNPLNITCYVYEQSSSQKTI
jgi:hypothetical protein